MISAIAVMLITVALYLMRSRSVLYAGDIAGDPVGESSFSIFNPFRDRSPEHVAETFLELMKGGQCEQAMAALPAEQEYRQYICESEKKYPLMSWTLKNRKDEPQKVKMFYWYWPEGSESHDRLWVVAEKCGEQWQITSYERYY
jgi:hypothetical protein